MYLLVLIKMMVLQRGARFIEGREYYSLCVCGFQLKFVEREQHKHTLAESATALIRFYSNIAPPGSIWTNCLAFEHSRKVHNVPLK
jgi:hypothetical protein